MLYVLHQTHSEFWHVQLIVFSGICQLIRSYSALLRHIHLYCDITRSIQAYWGIFSTLCNPCTFTTIPYSEPWHIRTRGLLKPCETLTRHIENLRQCLHMQKLDTLAILECSELFRNCIPHIHREYLKYLTYLKSNTFLEPFQRFKMDILAKIVKNYIYFSKMLILRSLTRITQ